VFGVDLSRPPAGKIYFDWIGDEEEDFNFVFGGPVLDRSNENKIQLVDVHFNSKTTTLVKKDIDNSWK
jgi:hypothetical protein